MPDLDAPGVELAPRYVGRLSEAIVIADLLPPGTTLDPDFTKNADEYCRDHIAVEINPLLGTKLTATDVLTYRTSIRTRDDFKVHALVRVDSVQWVYHSHEVNTFVDYAKKRREVSFELGETSRRRRRLPWWFRLLRLHKVNLGELRTADVAKLRRRVRAVARRLEEDVRPRVPVG